VTLSLDASADHYRFSSPLASLSVGQALELTFKPLRINESPDAKYSYTAEVWLWSTVTTSENYTDSGIALSLEWLRESEWLVGYFSPGSGWRHTREHLQIPLGEQQVVKVVRRADGVSEFFLNASSVLTLSDSEAVRSVLARVVGTDAEFSYVPLGSASLRYFYDARPAAPQPCIQCLRRGHQ